jgi:antitoxin HicB
MNSDQGNRDTNYPVKIDFDEQDKVYIAEFLDLPGCSATGGTVEEAYQRAQTAKQEWLRLSSEQGLPIPKPSRTGEYSGRFLLRLPPSLHAMLADRAKLQGSSLNQYAVHLLSGAVVGDSVSTQIDQLKRKVAGLEMHISQLSRSFELSRPAVTQQALNGMPVTVSTGPSLAPSGYHYMVFGVEQIGQYGEINSAKSDPYSTWKASLGPDPSSDPSVVHLLPGMPQFRGHK